MLTTTQIWSSGNTGTSIAMVAFTLVLQYSRLLLDTFDKFMRRDIHVRYKYLTRMASIIYQVEDLNVLDDIASTVSEFELEKEFDKAFMGKKQTDTKSMIMRWGQDLQEVDKFVRQILELHRVTARDVSDKTASSINLEGLVGQLKQITS